MNEDDIYQAARRHRNHALLGPATLTLVNMVESVNDNSDGWAYWSKPQRAASRLVELVQGDRMSYFDSERADVTLAKLKAAYTPLKAFRTRHGIDFAIVLPEGN